MPNDIVPAAATGLPDPRIHDLGKILFAMEDRLTNCVRWAHVIQDLGSIDGDVSAAGLFVIGNAMRDEAEAVMADWRRCLKLSSDMREGAR